MAGKSLFFNEIDYPFPKPLIEIENKTIIEYVVENLSSAGDEVQFIFVISTNECRKFHLDSSLNIITNHKCKIVRLDNETKGAVCSALMAINYIANDQPLIIANSDQLFDDQLKEIINSLGESDAGVVTFDSVHPRWSYVRVDEDELVIEAAEKRPISRLAIAGLYYFRRGNEFISAAMLSIQKDACINGIFYIAPILNELILMGKKISTIKIEAHRFHTFYTPQKIKEYEAQLQLGNIT